MSAGLCLQILAPAPRQVFTAGSQVEVRVQAALSCGCPPGAGGRYDYRRFQIKAGLARNGGGPVRYALAPSLHAGLFAGRIEVREPGDYLLEIEVSDPESGLVGRARVDFRVR